MEHVKHAVGGAGHVNFDHVRALVEGGFIGGKGVAGDVAGGGAPMGGYQRLLAAGGKQIEFHIIHLVYPKIRFIKSPQRSIR